MVCKLCPTRGHCWDKGTCETCDFGKAFNGLDAKNKKLKAQNKALEAENKELKEQINTLRNPNF